MGLSNSTSPAISFNRSRQRFKSGTRAAPAASAIPPHDGTSVFIESYPRGSKIRWTSTPVFLNKRAFVSRISQLKVNRRLCISSGITFGQGSCEWVRREIGRRRNMGSKKTDLSIRTSACPWHGTRCRPCSTRPACSSSLNSFAEYPNTRICSLSQRLVPPAPVLSQDRQSDVRSVGRCIISDVCISVWLVSSLRLIGTHVRLSAPRPLLLLVCACPARRCPRPGSSRTRCCGRISARTVW